MTVHQLRMHFMNNYGNEWPVTYEVDAETYANCCQSAFDWKMRNESQEGEPYDISVRISLGPNNGLLFKNVELIYKEKE